MVSSVIPREGGSGGEVRCLNVLRALKEMGTVEVLHLKDKSTSSKSEGKFTIAYTLEVKERAKRGFVEQLRWTIDPKVSYPRGCGVEEGTLGRVTRSLKEFDLIWFSDLRSSDMFPYATWRRSVGDVGDLPSMYERATLKMGAEPREWFQSLRRMYAWRRREKLLGEQFTVLTVCSEEDRQYLRRLRVGGSIHVIANGFERPQLEPVRRPVVPPRVGFIGLFDYFPNRDGIQWFLNRCWPRIKVELPGARLRLAGQDSTGFLNCFSGDIDRLGWLEDPSDEMMTWSVMVVPIRLGAGTRVKIAHGFSLKVPIVSTSLGAYGYGVVDERQIYLADSVEAFSKSCILAIREPEKARLVAERAWSEFIEKWTWDSIRPLVWAAAEDCLRHAEETGVKVDACFETP
jgi:hypothetical protein